MATDGIGGVYTPQTLQAIIATYAGADACPSGGTNPGGTTADDFATNGPASADAGGGDAGGGSFAGGIGCGDAASLACCGGTSRGKAAAPPAVTGAGAQFDGN